MRYALVGVAVVASLAFAWLGASYLLNEPANITAAIPAVPALAMGWVAFGLIKRQAWAAYLISVVAFLCALSVGLLILFLGPGNYRDQPPTPGFDPAWLILLGALALAVTVGAMAISVGGDLRRQRRERETK